MTVDGTCTGGKCTVESSHFVSGLFDDIQVCTTRVGVEKEFDSKVGIRVKYTQGHELKVNNPVRQKFTLTMSLLCNSGAGEK